MIIGLVSAADRSHRQSSRASRAKSKSSKSRHHDHQTCHLKEIDSCLDKIQTLAKGPNPSSIITTSEGLDKLCTTVNDILKCAKGYMKKCGTPLQREIYDLSIEYFARTLRKFCDEGPEREIFLKSSPCIHDKVLSTTAYKSNCNNNYIAALDFVANRTNVDERIDSLCCGVHEVRQCTSSMITEKCGVESSERFSSFLEKTFGGFASVMCPRNIFPPTGKVCKQALPPRGTKPRGKISDNFIGKYLNTYLSFIFNNA
ncbi:hypothetical protein RDWZM_003707 [Blomia tropicalis]|uniref:DUF19 domain-containing protein n=1 Tax=Blomia tropicalis TaxID=40697 RepID=A0A9Q0MIT3_BLOTA|nr:hypothetical protein BLOT_002690 [Blomia tropicalis]KAJ6225162.1 hypothetical protein RDWZM_003707 [Blomia tropicalis]